MDIFFDIKNEETHLFLGASIVFLCITGWGQELFNMPIWGLIITGGIGAVFLVLAIVFWIRDLKEEKEENQ